jgi:MFS family permease
MRQARPGCDRTAAPRKISASSAPAPSVAIVAAICGAEILGLAGFPIIPALLPQFIETWSLTNAQAGWLAGITSAGYMLAVIPLVSLTDRRPARQLYLASSALSALSCLGMGLCDSLLRAASGYRAWEYRPDWFLLDLPALRAHFINPFARPRRTIIHGQSMGRHISIASRELYRRIPAPYPGAARALVEDLTPTVDMGSNISR